MSGVRHTPLQMQTLELVAEGTVENRNCGTSAWRIWGASPTVVGRLIKMGLVRWSNGWNGVAELTEEGQRVLAARARGEQSPNHSDQKEVGNG